MKKGLKHALMLLMAGCWSGTLHASAMLPPPPAGPYHSRLGSEQLVPTTQAPVMPAAPRALDGAFPPLGYDPESLSAPPNPPAPPEPPVMPAVAEPAAAPQPPEPPIFSEPPRMPEPPAWVRDWPHLGEDMAPARFPSPPAWPTGEEAALSEPPAPPVPLAAPEPPEEVRFPAPPEPPAWTRPPLPERSVQAPIPPARPLRPAPVRRWQSGPYSWPYRPMVPPPAPAYGWRGPVAPGYGAEPVGPGYAPWFHPHGWR